VVLAFGTIPNMFGEVSVLEVIEDAIELRFRPRRFAHRTLDERLAVRFPGLLRAMARIVLRLPRKSRIRRYLFARRVCQGYQAVNRGDLDVLLAAYHDDATVTFDPATGLLPPDLVGEHAGHAGLRRLWEEWRSAWDELRLEPHELYDLGNGMVVRVTMTGRGGGSGLEISGEYFEVYEFRDGIISRHENYRALNEALAAAGLTGPREPRANERPRGGEPGDGPPGLRGV
jgi:ketosteroid isomerase-like protein